MKSSLSFPRIRCTVGGVVGVSGVSIPLLKMAAIETKISELFKISKLTDTQKTVICKLVDGLDVLLCVKTGGGKSLCYQAFPTFFSDKNDAEASVLIISPLISIMKEQCGYLTSLGLSACYVGQSEQTDSDIAEQRVFYTLHKLYHSLLSPY